MRLKCVPIILYGKRVRLLDIFLQAGVLLMDGDKPKSGIRT